MSATIDSRLFADYFGSELQGQLQPAPVLSVEGRLFNVREHYLDDVRKPGPWCKWCEWLLHFPYSPPPPPPPPPLSSTTCILLYVLDIFPHVGSARLFDENSGFG